MKEIILKKLQEIVVQYGDFSDLLSLDIPKKSEYGEYTTNIALQLSQKINKNPREIAKNIVNEFGPLDGVEKIKAVEPGFINIYLTEDFFIKNLREIVSHPETVGMTEQFKKKRFLVEYAHPNTHKEMHIGHMRTLVTGESLSRILEANGADVFRANYQGDIGLHVAKAIIGLQKLIQQEGEKKNMSLDQIWEEKRNLNDSAKAHLLGQGYVEGGNLYMNPSMKSQIDAVNAFLYQRLEKPEYNLSTLSEEKKDIWGLYEETRKWSLDYYDQFYKRFHTKFDKLFFESKMIQIGRKVIRDHMGKVFIKDTDGSIIFPGEKYGLHTRVFITHVGNLTYEGKEMGTGFAEWSSFHFDKKIHVVASEQNSYFQVVFKALDLIDPEKFEGKQYHLSMGMVQLSDRKISSRTGEVVTIDWLLDQVRLVAQNLFKEGNLSEEEKRTVLEDVIIGAVKYSILRSGTTQNVSFEIEKSVSLDGNSGPYIQYTYVRTQSLLKRGGSHLDKMNNQNVTVEEKEILRLLTQFSSVVSLSGEHLSPHTLCEYLFNLSRSFNLFYQKYRILNAEKNDEKYFRLVLTEAVGIILERGLYLIGIAAPKNM